MTDLPPDLTLCKKCGSEGPFYTTNRNFCRECIKARTTANRLKNPEANRRQERRRRAAAKAAAAAAKAAAKRGYEIIATTGNASLDELLSDYQRRMNRANTCKWLAEHLGHKVSYATLRNWQIPYKVYGREARYAEEDLLSFLKKRFDVPDRVSIPTNYYRKRERKQEL
jgi:hypothetical protein